MNSEEVKEYILDFQKRELPELVERELKVNSSKRIKTVVGPRRAGKTFFMFQKIKGLMESNVKKEKILYLNFEDPRLIEVNYKDVREIIKVHWGLYPESTKELFIFIDEPQNIKNWEIAIRGLYDEGFNIFLSGSSSKLLSKEIATSLRGRTLSYVLLPFSFREFLKMKNLKFDISHLSSKERAVMLNLLNEYLELGGFPEVILEENKENKIKIINEYFDLVVYRDIVERYKIKNTNLIRWLIKSLILSSSKEFSTHKAYLTLKSKGIRLSKNTLYSYLSMLEDAMFAFFVPKFKYSIRKREFSINKAYLCDTAFAKLAEVTQNKGNRMENVVLLELKRKPLTEIFYWSDGKSEVDFVVKMDLKIKQLIQVCYGINDYDVKKREIKALFKASKELKCKNLLVITENKEGEEKINAKKIKYTPLWKWLLEINKNKL